MKYSALIGNPVEHSISPKVFEILSNKLGVEYAHLKINVPSSKELPDVFASLNKLGFVGFNITIPYKIDTYNLLKDYCEDECEKIHSVNSVVIRDGKYRCYNTDGTAAIKSILHFYKIKKTDKVVLLGSGGASYPILFEILKYTKNVVVFNRTLENAKKMCDIIDKNIKYYDFSDKNLFIEELKKSTIIINSTSVGMHPKSDETLIDEEMFKTICNSKTKKCIFDVIFNPWNTKLIELAKKYNQIGISGGYMLIYQVISVFELWLDTKVNLSKKDIDDMALELIKYMETNHD